MKNDIAILKWVSVTKENIVLLCKPMTVYFNI